MTANPTAAEIVALARKAETLWNERFSRARGVPGLLFVVDAGGDAMLANRVHDNDLMWIETHTPEHTANVARALLASALIFEPTIANTAFGRGRIILVSLRGAGRLPDRVWGRSEVEARERALRYLMALPVAVAS